jgi:glycosyltransferase involved in cell wall biosynthesis
MVEMTVVLVAYHYPPDPAVGSLRAAKVARAFREAGHEVHVVTAGLPDDAETRAPVPAGAIIHSITPIRSTREVYTALKSRWSCLRRRPDGDGASRTTPWVPPASVAAWKRFLFSLMWLPDDRLGFILPAWRVFRSLGRNKIDLVYTTCPPYSPHLVGLLVKWRMRVRWVAEFRDPWAANTQKPWWVRSQAVDAVDAWLEVMCLRRADHIVSVSEGIHKRLFARLEPEQRNRCVVIRNGIERLAKRDGGGREPGPFRIVYVGTFYYSRDPRPFLRSLAAVRRKRGLGPEGLRVDLVGLCRWFGAVSVEEEVQNLGLGNVVRFCDWVPPATVRTILDQVDLLLLLAQDQPDQVPNKLYEYLGTRKPILAFADAHGETAHMLRQVGGHFVVEDEDETAAARAIETVLSRGQPIGASRAGEALLEEWTEEVQMRRLLATIGA